MLFDRLWQSCDPYEETERQKKRKTKRQETVRQMRQLNERQRDEETKRQRDRDRETTNESLKTGRSAKRSYRRLV